MEVEIRLTTRLERYGPCMLMPPELVSRKSAVQPSTVGSYSRKGM